MQQVAVSVRWLTVLLILLATGCKSEPVQPSGVGREVAAVALQFDGRRAHGDVLRQVAFGPRIPGSPGHEATADWLAGQLRSVADSVEVDQFVAAGLPLVNIIARFRPELASRVLLCAHWDTRPQANHDPDPSRRHLPVPGANDGASGVAVLLELARLFGKSPPPVGVDIVLFDGEDYGDFTAGWSDVLLGSQRYAQTHTGPIPRFGILLDMVGDADLCLPREENSYVTCPDVVDRVWTIADELGHGDVFIDGPGNFVVDDHIPLLLAGLRVIDIIDLDYDAWHTTADTPDKVSPHSLRIVGEVVAEVVYRELP